jgi:hypothetical protein
VVTTAFRVRMRTYSRYVERAGTARLARVPSARPLIAGVNLVPAARDADHQSPLQDAEILGLPQMPMLRRDRCAGTKVEGQSLPTLREATMQFREPSRTFASKYRPPRPLKEPSIGSSACEPQRISAGVDSAIETAVATSGSSRARLIFA